MLSSLGGGQRSSGLGNIKPMSESVCLLHSIIFLCSLLSRSASRVGGDGSYPWEPGLYLMSLLPDIRIPGPPPDLVHNCHVLWLVCRVPHTYSRLSLSLSFFFCLHSFPFSEHRCMSTFSWFAKVPECSFIVSCCWMSRFLSSNK